MSAEIVRYVQTICEPLVRGMLRFDHEVRDGDLRVTIYVTTATAKSRLIGRGGENIHAIQHLAREFQIREDPSLRVKIDVILGDGDGR